MPDPSHSAGPGAELQPDGGLETPDVAEEVEAQPRARTRGGYGPATRGRDQEQGELGVEDLLEDDDESMIHRFDFGLQLAPPPAPPPPKSIAAPESAPAAPPPPPLAEPVAEMSAQEPEAEVFSTEDAAPEAEAIEAQLEMEDRFDWAFSRGQHFAEAPRPPAPEQRAPEPEDLPPESTVDEPTTALPMPEPPAVGEAAPGETEAGVEPPAAEATAEASSPQPAPATKIRPKGTRKVEKPAVPGWLSAALAALVLLGALAVWGLLRSLETDNTGMTVEEELQDLAEGAPSEEPPVQAGDAGPGIEVEGLDVVDGPAGTDPAAGDGKLVLGAGGEPVVGLHELLPSEPVQPESGETVAGQAEPTAVLQPGRGAASEGPAATPEGQQAAPTGKRAWEPLVRGADLPGWQSRSREGWSVKEDVLTVRTPPGKKSATVLVTERKYRNLAFTFKARPETAGTTFGLLTRAQSGAAVRLEFAGSKGTLRAGDAVTPVVWEWKPGQWHQVALIAMDKGVLVYIDRRKVATLAEVAVDAAGRLGVYCTAGKVDFRAVYVQPLD